MTELHPLAHQIALRGAELAQQGDSVRAKMCAVVWKQLWDLLPAFCQIPTDLRDNFEALCQLIVPLLDSADERAYLVTDAMRTLVVKWDVSTDKNTLQFLGGYAEHILSPLFNKYVGIGDQLKQQQKNSATIAFKA